MTANDGPQWTDFEGNPIQPGSLAERTLGDGPEGWRPKVDDIIEGTVIEVAEATGGSYGDYPLVIVRTDAGKEVAIHCFHSVLASEVSRRKIEQGDRLAVRYVGPQEPKKAGMSPTEMYRVAHQRGTVAPAVS